jgi:molybdopterin converting factor small subunit
MNTRGETDRTDEVGTTVCCLFFARYAELLGRNDLQIVLPSGSTVADAVERVRLHVEGGHALPDKPLIAKNQRHVKFDCVVEDGDELAFLPPLAGG